MPIRVILSGYAMLSLSSLISLGHHQWNTIGQRIDALASYGGLAITLLFPIIALYIMLKHFKFFDNKQIKARYGSLYEDLDTRNQWIIAFRIWFRLRRLFLVAIIVLFQDLIA